MIIPVGRVAMITIGAVTLWPACAAAMEEDLHAQHAAHPHTRPASEASAGPADPLSVEVTYTADFWRVASGGVRKGSRYLDNLDVLANVDLEQAVGWGGATALVYGIYNNGKSLSELAGDAQVASNIETGISAVRLYEAWIDQRFAGDRASLRLGLYDLNSEFDALDTSSLFVGSAHGIGSDIAQTGENGPSIFPVTSLAVRLAVDLDDRWTLRAAVLDGVPGNPARPKRTAVKLGSSDGALLIAEAERRIGDGKILFGHWRYTASFDRLDGGRDKSNDGVYLRAESHLTHEAGDGSQGLAGFARLGLADGSINLFDRFASAGLIYTGAFPGRDEDQLGVALAAAFTSASYRQVVPSDRSEIALEMTYHAPITDALSLQPTIQYIINPGADPTRGNALLIGLRAAVTHTF